MEKKKIIELLDKIENNLSGIYDYCDLKKPKMIDYGNKEYPINLIEKLAKEAGKNIKKIEKIINVKDITLKSNSEFISKKSYVYVAVVSYGKYEDFDRYIIYVGFSYKDAKKAILDYEIPSHRDNGDLMGYVDYWKDGKCKKTKWIIE